MVFTPAPWYHLRPERAPGTLLVLLFDKLKPGKQKVPVHNYTRFTALRAVSHYNPINYPFGQSASFASPFSSRHRDPPLSKHQSRGRAGGWTEGTPIDWSLTHIIVLVAATMDMGLVNMTRLG